MLHNAYIHDIYIYKDKMSIEHNLDENVFYNIRKYRTWLLWAHNSWLYTVLITLVAASEWIGGDELKDVKIELDPDKYVLYVRTPEGKPIRSINLFVYEVITLHICPRSPFTVLIELPKSYDLVSAPPQTDSTVQSIN